MTKRYKTIRAVVEVRVPQHISEKRLVLHLQDILKWSLQLGHKDDHSTLSRARVKMFSRVSPYHRQSTLWDRLKHLF